MKEIREILKDLKVEILSMREAGIDVDIVEDGKTFEENALIKARTIRDLTGCTVLADDSGLEVDALNKEPGIYSARYMGEETSYDLKMPILSSVCRDSPAGNVPRVLYVSLRRLFPMVRKKPGGGRLKGRLPMLRLGKTALATTRSFMYRNMRVRRRNCHRSRKMKSAIGEKL